jgi:hypothetical protein
MYALPDICGNIAYELSIVSVNPLPASGNMDVNFILNSTPLNLVLDFSEDNLELIGDYKMQFKASLANYTQAELIMNFTVSVLTNVVPVAYTNFAPNLLPPPMPDYTIMIGPEEESYWQLLFGTPIDPEEESSVITVKATSA